MSFQYQLIGTKSRFHETAAAAYVLRTAAVLTTSTYDFDLKMYQE